MNWQFWKKDPAAQEVTEVAVTPRSSARVQMALLVEMMRMLQEYQQSANLPVMPDMPVKSERLQQLERLGFTNTMEWKDYNQRMTLWNEQMKARREAEQYVSNAQETVEVLKDARSKFGNDTLLVRFDDFERLMDKYNLVCGTFDAYTGDVPLDKMGDISKLDELMRVYRAPHYINLLQAVTSYEAINHIDDWKFPTYLTRFPFVKAGPWYSSTEDLHGNDTWEYSRGYRLHFGQETSLFICAPSKDMKKLERIVSLRTYNDPFICAHTDYGILVFTRWGEEADDAIVRKYEQVNQIIDGLTI